MKRHVLLIILMVAVVPGCQKEKDTKQKQAETQSPHRTTKKETTVVVPDAVRGKWSAVKIKVTDKAGGADKVYTASLGGDFSLPDSRLKVKVLNFLPDFIMSGATLTSQSNELKNPAAQIKIYDGDKEIFKGWLFAKFPTTHAFQHPRYGFTLYDYVPGK